MRISQILNSSTSNSFIWSVIFIFPFLSLWQGGDLTDTGYNLTVYHFFFDRLNENITESQFFLTAFTGGIWNSVFNFLGVSGIKILGYVFLIIIVMISADILNSRFPAQRKIIPWLLLAAGLFSIRSFPFIFNYDVFTTFWFILLLYVLRDPKNWNSRKLIIAGVIIAMCGLSRFPNFVFIVLFTVLLVFIKIRFSRPFPEIKYYWLFPWLGFGLGIILFVLLLSVNDDHQPFLHNFYNLIFLADSSSSHNFSTLFLTHLKDLAFFAVYVVIIFIFYRLYQWVSKRIKALPFRFLLVLTFFSLTALYPFVLNYNHSVKYTVPATALVLLFHSRITVKDWIFAGILFLCAITQTLGSNTGIFLKLNLLSIIYLPFTFLLHEDSKKRNYAVFSAGFVSYVTLASLFLLLSGYYGVGYGFLDRKDYVNSLDIPGYQGIHTTAGQKKISEEYYNLLKRNAWDKEKLFIFGHAPMMYYLTDLEPATHYYWLTGLQPAALKSIIKSIPNEEEILILEDRNIKFTHETRKYFHQRMHSSGFQKTDSAGQMVIWKKMN